MSKNDLLRTKLKNWEKDKRNPAFKNRGGEDGDIWNLELAREEEKAEKERLKREAEIARLEKDKNTQNTINELYKRILKVEKLSAKIGESGILAGIRRGRGADTEDGASTDRGTRSMAGASRY